MMQDPSFDSLQLLYQAVEKQHLKDQGLSADEQVQSVTHEDVAFFVDSVFDADSSCPLVT